MKRVALAYGEDEVTVELPEALDVGVVEPQAPTASDNALGTIAQALDQPVGAKPFQELAAGCQRVAIVVPDPTRRAPAHKYLLPVFSRLARVGIGPDRISLIVGRGLHGTCTRDEVAAIVGEEVAATIRPVQSAPETPGLNQTLFEDERLGPVRVHRIAAQADLVLLTGIVQRHHLAGHGGGAKGLIPGIAERDTILAAHRLTLDALVQPDGSIRLPGARGRNRFRAALTDVATRWGKAYVLDVLLDEAGEIADAVAGDVEAAHAEAAARFEAHRGCPPPEADADLVLIGTRAPRSNNLIQAHKSLLEGAAHAAPGGRLLWCAQAPAGPGHSAFLPWFEAGPLPRHLASLREHFHPYGLTAYSVRRLAKDFAVHTVSEVAPDILRPMGLMPARTAQAGVDRALADAAKAGRPVQRVKVLPAA